jgi:DNA-binding NarL/FixJ family response regulator
LSEQSKFSRRAQVKELANEGLDENAIAQRLGLRLTTVRNYRAKALVSAGAPLSEREKQVSDLARQGLTNAVIGQQLGISTRTVEVHRQNAFKKLGAGNAAQLAHMHKDQEKDDLRKRVAELEVKVASLEEHIARLEGNA